jgi:hypothetical protein
MTAAALCWLIRDVFRRARASGFLHCVVATIIVVTLGCALLRWDDGRLTLLGWQVASPSTLDSAVREFQFHLAWAVGDVFGVLVTLLATAAFLPTFLDPAAVTVLLAKPVSRGALLLGRFLGITLFVVIFAGLFVTGTATAIGVKTGVWVQGYWIAWPLLVVQFIAFGAGGALIAVSTRSTVAVMIGSILFALISWGISFGKHFFASVQIDEARPEFGRLVDYVYWILPKPTDFSLMLHQAMGASTEQMGRIGLRPILERGLYSPGWAVASTLAVAVVLLGLAVYELNHQDY